MLHTVLHLERPLIVFDTETTGTNPQRDRIVEFAFKLYTMDGLQKAWKSLINPGIPIPAKVAALHGIDDARMGRCRVCDQIPVGCTCEEGYRPIPAFKAMAPSIAKGFRECDYAGKNIRFDLKLLDAEMHRAEQPWSYAGARIIDADRLEQLAEPRTLTALYKKHTGGVLEGAHGAMADVDAVVTVIEAQLTVYTESLPRDIDALHHLQWPDWITNEGQFRFEDGVPTCCFGQKYRGESMHKIPRDFWDWILRNDFPEDVRQLARDAKLGKFPERTAE
jgi:DNA polymerase-3 subunit epsilon